VFERCLTNAPWTLPSYLSLMSGMYANSNRIPRSALPEEFDYSVAELWEMWAMPDNRWTLAEALRGSGYQTGGFVDCYWLSDRFQFTQGFETFDYSPSQNSKTDPEGGIRMVSRLALEWLDGKEGAPGALERGPVFLFAHCFDAHGPYSADEGFHGRFDGDELYDTEHKRLAGIVGSAFGGIHSYITAEMYDAGETPREVATGPLIADYDEGVALVDDEIGKLLAQLKERGVYDDAMIILTADHGEAMEKGDTPFSHSVMDETVTHVPLIVKLPGNANAGRRVKQNVQLVDLYPTILDRLGLPLDREMLHGRSLVPLMNGESLPDVPTLCEGGNVRQAAVHLGDWKLTVHMPAHESSDRALITYPGLPDDWTKEHFPELLEDGLTAELYERYTSREDYEQTVADLRGQLNDVYDIALYRLSDDPDEERNLKDVDPPRVNRMLAILKELTDLRDAAQRVASPPTKTVRPSESDLEQLESLGYAGK